MKHKVSELEGALLDAAVAKAEGVHFILGREVVYGPDGEHYHPSTDWLDAGPIIERERIAVLPWTEANAVVWTPDGNAIDWTKSGPLRWWARADEVVIDYIEECPEAQAHYTRDGFGPTPLIAAMRAYVASKLGEEVEL